MSNEIGLKKEKESPQTPSDAVAPAERGSACQIQGLESDGRDRCFLDAALDHNVAFLRPCEG